MSRVTSLTELSDQQLNKWIKRIGLLLLVGTVAFIAFYAVDRFRASPAPIVDRELTTLEEIVRTNPADAVARGQLADLYYVKGRYEEAITQYSTLIDGGKQVQLASLGRAKALVQTEQLDKAVPDFQKVIEIGLTSEMAASDPILAAGYFGLGSTYLAQDKADEAIEQLVKARAIQRTDADVLYTLGTAYIETGKAGEAREALNLAIALVPNGWPEPYLALETLYKDTGDAAHAEWAGAMAAFAGGDPVTAITRLQAIAAGDAALEAAVGLGVINEFQGDTAAAATWYQKALAINPENSSAKLGIGRVALPSPSASDGSN